MSFDNIPSKSEVMRWDSHHLADFFKRQNFSGCDKVVVKCNMNGKRFLNMSDNDLQKFPKLHAPLISKICREINKKEDKRSFFPLRSSTNKFPETVDVPQDDQGWDSGEFDSEEDYENPNSDDDDDGSNNMPDYEAADDGGGESDNDYEPPPSEPPEDLHHHQICPAKPMSNSDYIDRSSVKTSQPPMPPARPGPGSGPPPPAPGRPSIGGTFPKQEQSTLRPPTPDRSKKPGGNASAPNERIASMPRSGRNVGLEKVPEPSRMLKPPPLTGVRRSASSVTPSPSHNRPDPRNEPQQIFDDHARPSLSNTFPHTNHARNPSPRPGPHGHSGQTESVSKTASLPIKLPNTITSQRASSRMPPHPMRPSEVELSQDQDMDSSWYVGQVTRGQAESNLRQVNRDGAFLVRDSSKGSETQPYTLMVLYQDKVFNIQIRKKENGFQLGTGLKSCEDFSRVSDIIKQHTQMPLLLIDAKNRGSCQQNQCALTYPAGF
ncbi:lymphocyte cytosolic protein 2a isoform X2 [Trichomycterus rosablanca]|uniref:lymphocyte cytosolic protein 2a isoform X2 n=1 Tax=Trichomycterus rosablanca TaxID=2290929 RepID=UPI002F3605A4